MALTLRVLVALSLGVASAQTPAPRDCGGGWFLTTTIDVSCPAGYTEATRDECLHLNGVVGQTCNPPGGTLTGNLESFQPVFISGCSVYVLFGRVAETWWNPLTGVSYEQGKTKSNIIPCKLNNVDTTSDPTLSPTFHPSLSPTFDPSLSPTSFDPTLSPTFHPSPSPTFDPSLSPTLNPTPQPTSKPFPATDQPSRACPSRPPANCVPCTIGGDDCAGRSLCVDGQFIDPRDCKDAGTGNVVTFVTGQGIESVPPCNYDSPTIYINSFSGCDISGDRPLRRKLAFGHYVPEEVVPEDALIIFDVCLDSLTLKEANQQRDALREAGAVAAGVDVSQVSVTFIIGCVQGRRRLQATDDFVTVQYDVMVPGTDGLTGVAAVRGKVEELTPGAFDSFLEEEGVNGVSTKAISVPEIGDPRTDSPTVSPTGSPTTHDPTASPTFPPTATADPTAKPNADPTAPPSTAVPSTAAPSTAAPIPDPTMLPTADPYNGCCYAIG